LWDVSGQKELRLRNWDKLPIDPKEIDLVVITMPTLIILVPSRLVKDGSPERLYALLPRRPDAIMFARCRQVTEEEALFAFKKGYSKHSKPEPLFTTDDANW